jgi:hypothetical protein
MIKPNPFTPQSGWEPKVFGGREGELLDFKKTLAQAVASHPNHIVVIGEWGIGKTSLLKQYKKIAQSHGYPASYCSISRFSNRSKPIDGINLITQEMAFGFPRTKSLSRFLEDIDTIGLKMGFVSATLKKEKKKKKKLAPQIQFTNFLLTLFKSLKTKLAVVLLDDVQNLLPISEVIDILKNVLSKDEVLSRSKYLFVLSSTPEGWSGFIDKHDPIGRFFRRRESINPLTKIQVESIILGTLKNTGVTFEKEVIEKTFSYTQGHPYELQLLCSHLYDSQIEGKVSMKVWEGAFVNTLRELGRDYFDSLYKRASERERDVLEILAEKNTPLKITDIRSIMITEKRAKNFPVANIKNFLYRLKDKGLIKKEEDNAYKILDPMFAEYVQKEKSKE